MAKILIIFSLTILASINFSCSKTEQEKTEQKLLENYWVGENENKNLIVFYFTSDNKYNVYELFYCLTDCSQFYDVITYNSKFYRVTSHHYNWQWENEYPKYMKITDKSGNEVTKIKIIDVSNTNLKMEINDIESELVVNNSLKKDLKNL